MAHSVKPEKEISFASSLIPDGTLVECVIAGSDVPKGNDKGNFTLNWELTVVKGPYKDSRFYDNVGTAGQERYVNLGLMKMSYALEINKQAHTTGDYNIENHKVFNGMRVVIRVGVEAKQGKDGGWFHVNKAIAYASPRPDSSNYHLWQEYTSGQQPYQTDKLPPLPVAGKAPGGHAGGYQSGPPAGQFDDSVAGL